MTTTWQATPPGADWREVDGLVALVEDLVATEARPGGVHQVRWEPGRSTRVAYDRPDGEVVVVEVGTDGMTRSTLAEDRALPGVRTVLDPDEAARRFAMLLGGPPGGCRSEVVSYRPGSRCVIRCTLREGAGSRTYFVKVLADGFDEYVEAHEALATTLDGSLPPLVGYWPDLRAVVTGQAPGRTLSAVLGADDDLPLARTALAVSLGGLLARVHATRPGPRTAARLARPEDELTELAGYLPVAWHADPTAGLSMTWALEALRRGAPPATPPVLGHGSFRTGQVLVDDTRLALLDLDSAGLAPPERDLGNALAYLDWQRLRRNPEAAAELPEAFLEGYREHGGRFDADALAWWHAAALLKIAGRRYRSLDTTTWPAVPRLVSRAGTLLEGRRRAASEPALAPVPEVTDPRRMSGLLRGVLGGGTAEVDLASAEILRLAPGRRVVVRYELEGDGAVHPAVIAKAYAEPARAVLAHENLSVFAALPPDGTGVRTQPPLGVLPDRGIVVCGAAPGRPLTEHEDPDTAAATAHRVGRWLAGVHRVRSGPSRLLSLDREIASVRQWAAEVGRSHLRLAAPARALAEALTRAAADLPAVDARLIHKDLHLGHVVVTGDGTTSVIDLDEVRLGDPVLDVAHLCAYADDAGDPVSLAARGAFLAGYGPLPGPAAARRWAFFYAYTLLKITKQDARGTLSDGTVRAALRRLSRGTACLAA